MKYYFCTFIIYSLSIAILFSQNIGIGTNTPSQRLEVNGKIKIGNDSSLPYAGTIRWNNSNSDLEVFDGSIWKSLTKSALSPWGLFNINENQIIAPSDGSSDDYFGQSVAISNSYIIVGCPKDDIGSNTNQGSAYIFFYNGYSWVQQSKLVANDGSSDDEFGGSVSINGDYCIIGSRNDDIGSNLGQGSAYIFYRNGSTWTQQAKLQATDGANYDEFGNSVDISGDYCIIGAYRDDVGTNPDQGSAYIFRRNGGVFWTQQTKLIANDGALADYFGNSVAIDETKVVIGSFRDDISQTDQGSAYIFTRISNTWSQTLKLIAPNVSYTDYFGQSVDIAANTIVVGAPNSSISVYQQGVAYIWEYNGTTWVYSNRINAGSPQVSNYFGFSVSTNGEEIIIGCPGTATSKGQAILFKKELNSWAQTLILSGSTSQDYDFFGASCCISDNYCIIGVQSSDINSSNEGIASIFKKN